MKVTLPTEQAIAKGFWDWWLEQSPRPLVSCNTWNFHEIYITEAWWVSQHHPPLGLELYNPITVHAFNVEQAVYIKLRFG